MKQRIRKTVVTGSPFLFAEALFLTECGSFGYALRANRPHPKSARKRVPV